MVDMAHFAGLVAGRVFTGDEDPVPHAHVTTTTTHVAPAARRVVLATSEYADAVDKGCPMVLGGPLHVGRQGRRACRGAPASFQTHSGSPTTPRRWPTGS
jgi:glycine/serine hydroxymethyltransferase